MPLIPVVTIVGSAPVSGISEAWDINEFGTVVGQEDTVFPFVWTPSVPNGTRGTSVRLPVLPHPISGSGTATALNTSGDVVGFCETVDSLGATVERAVLWARSAGAPISLNTLRPNPLPPGGFLGNSRALGINDSGMIVGVSDSALGPKHAFLFDPAIGVMRDLGSLLPAAMRLTTPDPSQALAIDAAGNVVGNATAADAKGNVVTRAFLVTAGALFMSDLGTLIPDPSTAGAFQGDSSAIAINAKGAIVGDSDAPTPSPASTGAFFGAGVPPTGIAPVSMTVLDINDNGVVVGSLGNPPTRAFQFPTASGIGDLSALLAGYTIERAVAINNHGQVAGIANNGTVNIAVLITF